jgi:Fe-Mn family superoxide dismutase
MTAKSKSDQSKKPAAEDSAAGLFSLPPLPYAYDALVPAISARTLKFHHGKHHKAYINKLNGLIKGTPLANLTLEQIIRQTAGKTAHRKIFNNAAQAWNHSFYWSSLSPKATKPGKELQAAIDRDFGDMAALKEKLLVTATDHFASGWAWLVQKGRKLEVTDTHDAATPFVDGARCLLVIDVWEHAYYLDRKNDRKAYVKAVIDSLLNWKFASANFNA